MKKIVNIFIWALIVIGSFFSITSVNALSERMVEGKYVKGPFYFEHKRGAKRQWEQARFINRKSDGAWVYCIQPFVKINEKKDYDFTTEDMFSVANISYENWKRIEKIAYYGYGYSSNNINHNDEKWWAATQMLIWQYADPSTESYFTSKLGGARNNNILKNEMNEIENLVNNHTKLPKFDNIPETIVVNNKLIIEDINGVLANFEIGDIVGGKVTIDNTSLIIVPNTTGDLSFSIIKNGNRYSEPVRLYYAVDSQNVVRRGNIDPIRKTIKLKVIGGKVTPIKYDKDTSENKPQGEATFKNAKYGIYKEDGIKVSEVILDENGKATSDYLPILGKYYLLEEESPKGYEIDKNKYYFEISKDNLNPSVQVFDKVINLDFDFTKVFSSETSGIMVPEIGIKFGVYDNKGKLVKELMTDDQGNMNFNLPYGSYVFKQITCPPGRRKIEDFTIKVEKSGDVVKKVLVNTEIAAKLKVIKIDYETKEIIKRSGIKFKIKSLDKNEYVCQNITYPTAKKICEFETDANGIMITPHPLPYGKYLLEEVDQKIDGYLWNKESKPFEIGDEKTFIEDNELGVIFETRFENKPVKGELEIKKTGEINNSKKDNNNPLEGVVFGLYNEKDVLIKKLVTNEKGIVIAKNLPLGKYYVKELKTLPNYVLDDKKYEFELSYKDQNTSIIKHNIELNNKLKKGQLEFTKTDFSTSEPLPNTKLEIYTNNDELVYSGITDEKGQIIINELPLGKYYIVEKEPSSGYLINEERVYFEIKEDKEIVKATMTNKKIKGDLLFTKLDISTSEPLPNTKIEIYTDKDKLIYSGITDEKGQILLKELDFGKYYIIEKEAPIGYQINNEKMYFEIKNNGEIVKATMVDEKIEIEVPDTMNKEYKVIEIISGLFILVGCGVLIYGFTKKR